MNESKNDSFDDFVAEFSASLSAPQSEAVLRRINTERMVRLIADDLIASHTAQRIRVLADSRLAGETGADFLMQIDDYDLRLEIVDTADGTIVIRKEQLASARQLLEDNPSTVALVLVWTTSDLKAVHLSLARLRHVEQDSDGVAKLIQKAKSLAEVLPDIIAHHVKQWEFVLQASQESSSLRRDIRQLFENAIGSAIEEERERAYKNLERKLAARQFPVEEEKRLIFAVLKDALQGVPAKELQPRLTRLPRRGRQ